MYRNGSYSNANNTPAPSAYLYVMILSLSRMRKIPQPIKNFSFSSMAAFRPRRFPCLTDFTTPLNCLRSYL